MSPLFLCRDYQTASISRRRNLLSRRSLHRSLYEIEVYVLAGDFPGWMPACITSMRRMHRYGFCEKVIFVET